MGERRKGPEYHMDPTLRLARLENSGAQLYGVNSIPHTVLVDKDGTIIAKNLHGEEIDAKLQEILK